LPKAQKLIIVGMVASERLSFLWQRKFPEAITDLGMRVATFYELPGVLDRALSLPAPPLTHLSVPA
jgi:hypothetical protein